MTTKRQPSRGRVVNRKELAAIFNVVPSTINKWVDELGMPQLRPGSRGVPSLFNSADCIEWRIAYVVRSRFGGADDDDPSASASVSLRKARANTTIAEAKASAALETIVTVADAKGLLDGRLARIAKRLDAIASRAARKVAGETDPRACQAAIDAIVNGVRKGIVEAANGESG